MTEFTPNRITHETSAGFEFLFRHLTCNPIKNGHVFELQEDETCLDCNEREERRPDISKAGGMSYLIPTTESCYYFS